MSELIKSPEIAGEVRGYLEHRADQGYKWVVYDTDNPIVGTFDLTCFKSSIEAFEFARENQQIFNWHEADSIDNLIFNLRKEERKQAKDGEELTKRILTLKTKTMNLNNLEDRKEEAKNLGFSDKTIAQIEENMRLGVPNFKAYDSMPATGKGQIDFTLNFKQSTQSDYYYWNNFQAVHNRVDPLEPGQKYMIITKGENGKNMVKRLDNVNEAIDLFKKQEGNAELAIGKDAAHKNMVANMENGTVNFVAKTFQAAYYANPIPQTFYIEEGRGFNKEQAGNLLQRRAVHRDDLLNTNGVIYQAWVMLNTDKPRDKHNNYPLKTYHDPGYGFKLEEAFKPYNIKDLEKPEKAKEIYESVKNGNRVLVTAEKKNGETLPVYVEAAVRFNKINFFLENGKPEKREEFLKPENKKEMNIFAEKLKQMEEKNQKEGVGLGR